MGILGDIGKIIKGSIIGGGSGTIAIFTTLFGRDVVEGTIDVAREVVKIGSDVYRAIPPEAFAFAGDPLHGLLKHEFEDEIVWIGQIGANVSISMALSWPALGPEAATSAILEGLVPLYITAGSVIGKIHHRLMNDQEWEMAQYIFRGTLADRSEIVLTNLGGLDGAAFVYPGTTGAIFVNLGRRYVHNATIPDGAVLIHELTHVWQARQRLLAQIFLYSGIGLQVTEDDPYPFAPGGQWSSYNIEQQASIVEAWARGATALTKSGSSHFFDLGARGRFTIGSPLFRYINGNIRRGKASARTTGSQSTRQLLREGRHHSVKEMHSQPPAIWWS